MKIVHVCITGIWGEQYAYQENLLPHYHKLMCNDVTIIAATYSRYTNGKPDEEPVGITTLQDGIKLIRLEPAIKNYKINGHLHLVKGLKKALMQEKPDLLFVHDLACFNFMCLPSVKAKFPSLKIVFDNHADLVNSLHSPLTRFLHKKLYRYILAPKLINIGSVFYGVTPSRCDFLHQIYGVPNNKIRLLIMGADDEKMNFERKTEIREKIRKQYSINDDDFLIVTGGKIDKKKNIHLLAKAVNQIESDKIKLIIFGKVSPDLQNLFEKEKSSKVQMMGWVNSDKVYEYFYAADLVMFSGLHSVLWEQAVASKTPCAFTKIEGFEHVDFNNNCILMEDSSVAYYSKLIEKVTNDKSYYETLRENSNSVKVDIFYYSNIAKQVLKDVDLIN